MIAPPCTGIRSVPDINAAIAVPVVRGTAAAAGPALHDYDIVIGIVHVVGARILVHPRTSPISFDFISVDRWRVRPRCNVDVSAGRLDDDLGGRATAADE